MKKGFYWLLVDMDGKGERWQLAYVNPDSAMEGEDEDGKPLGQVRFPALDFTDTLHEGFLESEKVGPLDAPVADRTKPHRSYFHCTECGWAYIGQFSKGYTKTFRLKPTYECPKCGKHSGRRISTLEGVQ